MTYITEAYVTPMKLIKSPDLPPFLEADPIPKDKGSWEQWEFQIKWFLDTDPLKLYMLLLFIQ